VFRSILTILASISILFAASTPIPIAINCGNPAFPFPQFQPYKNSSATLGNLADHNGVGVTHSEMEQTIRDGYRIMMNAATKPGGGVGGIDYIKYRSNPQCSEGDGYGLLGAAAMADKTTFDGIWLYIHDFTLNKVKRYRDCQESSPGYSYSQLPGWTGAGANSATDGDVDIALALLTAYYQWGEFMGIKDACGNQVSYKQATIDFLKGLTDTLTYGASGSLLSGDIGIDGYFKGGDSWAELSGWATAQNTATIGITKRVEQPGPTNQHIDYTAPAYFQQFADFLAGVDSAKYAWNIFQFRRATASSDWLMGKLYQADPKNIPFAGWVELSASNQTTFTQFNEGEDFRCAWRTILNYVWNGNPSYSWDPATHKVTVSTPNTYERDFGQRYAKFLSDNRKSPWTNTCVRGANPTFAYWGPLMLLTDWDMNGSGGNFFFLNWIHGTGSISAVTSQDFNLMAEMYRQLEIEWDVETPGDGYLTSVPKYYHGWFRMLGLLMLSGNYHAPSALKPAANMKVYLSIDKTFAFEKDTVTYTIGFRNYGSDTAHSVDIADTLHNDFMFVSATRGGVHNAANNTVTWNIGNVPYYRKDDKNGPMQDSVKVVVKIRTVTNKDKQYRNKATISCSNGNGWTSNEYPNRISSVMERNYLDIAKRALVIKKTADKSRVKPGSTVQYTIEFENTSDAGWINGGRPGVQFSFMEKAMDNNARNVMGARIFHDADEAYIDLGNYRYSYFLYDSVNKCIQGSAGCTSGWAQQIMIIEPDTLRSSIKVAHELITPGQDSLGKWNQRLILQFSDPTKANRAVSLVTIDHHLSEYRGMQGRIHKGGTAPLRIVWYYNSFPSWGPVNWSDDWSYDARASDDDGGMYFPVTNDWTDLEHPDIPVNTWNPKACTTATHTIKNILVEEWDGYTWRRVAGNGPMPGRDASNVTIRDTIPAGFSFVGFTSPPPLNIAPIITGNVITWSIPALQIKQKGTITYTVKADGSCPTTPDLVTANRAWISADKESPFSDSAIVTISCDTVVSPPKPDHLDIILDTTAIDPRRDADPLRITMDAGTRMIVVYAVVRDAAGNFLNNATTATWTSSDLAVATVAGAGWQGTITKTGAGSTTIIVTSPGLKPDTLYLTAIATPPWPAIVSATMLDNDANIIPDMLTLTLTDTPQVNQRLDSIVITYRGNRYSIPAASVTRQGTVIRVPFATLSGIDARPTGQVSIVMTVEGAEKRESKNFIDGVCPALLAADVLENTGTGNDVLYLTFSEPIDQNVLIGKQLQLIKVPGGAVITLDIDHVVAALNDSMVTVEVSPATQRPVAGDSLRLVPGSAGGMIVDGAKNRPHDLNKPVLLGFRPGPSSITSAYYIDANADGVIDSARIGFNRAVQPDELSSVVIQWDLRYFTIPITSIASSGVSAFSIPLRGSVIDPAKIATGGAMEISIKFTKFPDIIRLSRVADSAAPVIDSAMLYPGATVPGGSTLPDTLWITFSEQVPATAPMPFLLRSKADLRGYSFTGSVLSGSGMRYKYLVNGTIPSDITPRGGDSIWLDPGAAVSDAGGKAQRNELNRRVVLKIIWPLSIWTIKIASNPFDPDATKLLDEYKIALGATAPPFGTGILARTNSPIDPALVNGDVTIYDALGNVILTKPMTPFNGTLYFAWDGTNKNIRKVGSGTYLASLRIRENGQQVVSKKLRLGVKRGR
jgi:uncharacterized repeat protein (TIGR01451 family)